MVLFYTTYFDGIYSALLCCNKKPNYMTYASLVSPTYTSCLTIFACNSLHFFMPNKCSINKCYLTYALVVLMKTG